MSKGEKKMTDILIGLIHELDSISYKGLIRRFIINKKIRLAKNKMFLSIKNIKSYKNTDIVNICLLAHTARILKLYDNKDIIISYSDNDELFIKLDSIPYGSITANFNQSSSTSKNPDEFLKSIRIFAIASNYSTDKNIHINWTLKDENKNNNTIEISSECENISINSVEVHTTKDILYNSTYWILYNIYAIIVENIMSNVHKRWINEKT